MKSITAFYGANGSLNLEELFKEVKSSIEASIPELVVHKMMRVQGTNTHLGFALTRVTSKRFIIRMIQLLNRSDVCTINFNKGTNGEHTLEVYIYKKRFENELRTVLTQYVTQINAAIQSDAKIFPNVGYRLKVSLSVVLRYSFFS